MIRLNLAKREPKLPPIGEIRETPIAGLYEVRISNEVVYSDATGRFLIQGDMVDLSSGLNLTQERLEKINAIDFATLPLKDAVVWKVGNGRRKLAVFADPNCGYCKKFEHTLQEAKDLTVYTFIIPILGGDSPEKSRAIWCQKDNTTAWKNWMLDGKMPFRVMGSCDSSALERNLELSRKHRINGTPALIFEDGSRAPGAMPLDLFEKRLSQVSGKG